MHSGRVGDHEVAVVKLHQNKAKSLVNTLMTSLYSDLDTNAAQLVVSCNCCISFCCSCCGEVYGSWVSFGMMSVIYSFFASSRTSR